METASEPASNCKAFYSLTWHVGGTLMIPANIVQGSNNIALKWQMKGRFKGNNPAPGDPSSRGQDMLRVVITMGETLVIFKLWPLQTWLHTESEPGLVMNQSIFKLH